MIVGGPRPTASTALARRLKGKESILPMGGTARGETFRRALGVESDLKDKGPCALQASEFVPQYSTLMGATLALGRDGSRGSPLSRFSRWQLGLRPLETTSISQHIAGVAVERDVPLLPMHLPHYQTPGSASLVLQPVTELNTAELVARRWTDNLISYFNFIELGCPKTIESISWSDHWHVTPEQQSYADDLYADVLRETRRRSDNSADPPRGPTDLLHFIAQLDASTSHSSAKRVEELSTTALPIVPERLGVPTNAGSVWPGDHLEGEQLYKFLHRDARVLDPLQQKYFHVVVWLTLMLKMNFVMFYYRPICVY